MRWSLFGSMRIWLKYIGRGLVGPIFVQVAPTLSERFHAALFLVFYSGINDVWIAAIDIKPYSPLRSFRDSFREFSPSPPSISGLINRAAVPASVKPPSRAATLICRCVNDFVIRRVHHQLRRAGVRISLQDIRPGQSTVRRFVHPALASRSPQTPQSRNINDVIIDRINDDPRDVLRITKPHVFPALAAIN